MIWKPPSLWARLLSLIWLPCCFVLILTGVSEPQITDIYSIKENKVALPVTLLLFALPVIHTWLVTVLSGQVDEWQSLGNFNVPSSGHPRESPQAQRRADVGDENEPCERIPVTDHSIPLGNGGIIVDSNATISFHGYITYLHTCTCILDSGCVLDSLITCMCGMYVFEGHLVIVVVVEIIKTIQHYMILVWL